MLMLYYYTRLKYTHCTIIYMPCMYRWPSAQTAREKTLTAFILHIAEQLKKQFHVYKLTYSFFYSLYVTSVIIRFMLLILLYCLYRYVVFPTRCFWTSFSMGTSSACSYRLSRRLTIGMMSVYCHSMSRQVHCYYALLPLLL